MEHLIEMTVQQDHIAGIYKEYTTPSRVLRSFANLSNTVIQTALSGQSKFVFEILQNADDDFENSNETNEVQFILHDDYLIVHHNGKGFNYNDVERICDYASQIEEVKATDLSKTGYKGLGFKSLFNLSDCIYIHSNGYSFRFDKSHWPDAHSKPWQIIPIWCKYDELPLHNEYSYEQRVNFILKVIDFNDIENQLREVVKQPELILYLHRINKLSVNFNGEKYYLERKIEPFELFDKVEFYKNQNLASTWLSRTYERAVPDEVKKLIQGANRFIYPDKIKKARKASFTFSLRSEETLKVISVITGLCYSTLPTQLHLTLPYHINSIFILNLDRTQLHENEWNEFLIYQIGQLQLFLLKDLAEIPYLKKYVIELLVRKIEHHFASFNIAFRKGFMDARNEIGWLPAHYGSRLLKLGEAWTDETEFFKQNFQYIENHKIYPYLINYDVKNREDLISANSEAEHFTYFELFKDFPNKYYPQLTRESYMNFVSYLHEKMKSFPPNDKVIRELKYVPFLVAKNRALIPPIYALIEEKKNPIPNFCMLNPIDNDCLPSSDTDLIKNWLVLLGARRLMTPIEVIRESILKWIDSGSLVHTITLENHIEIINYLSKYTEALTVKETEMLKDKLLILTEGNLFKLAKRCYFPDAVPFKELADIISKDEKISSSYDIGSLKGFFIHVGVCEKMHPIDVLRRSILAWIKCGVINNKLNISNYGVITEYIASHHLIMENYLAKWEKEELRKFPVLTCCHTFQKAEDCYFHSVGQTDKGLEFLIAKNKLLSTEGMSDTVHMFLSRIGVSEIEPIQVIRRSILQWIKSGEISNKLNMNNYKFIIEFVALHYFILEICEKEELRKFPVLTCSHTFQKAEDCYFHSVGQTDKGLEFLIAKNELVSTEGMPDSVHMFLSRIGVSEIEPIQVIRRSILKWIKSGVINNKLNISNCGFIVEYIASHYLIMEYSLRECEKKELRKLPVLTCCHTFQKAEDCYFDSALPKIKELQDVISRNMLVSGAVPSDVSKFFSEIGVSDKIPSIYIIRNSVLKWIQENDVAKIITIHNHVSILEYVAEEWLTLKSSGLKPEEKNTLKRIPILTKGNTFRAACDCFWQTSSIAGSQSEEIPGLDKIISDDELVSSVYFISADELVSSVYFISANALDPSVYYTQAKMKSMFKELGVRKIKFENICEKYCDHLTRPENVKWFFSQFVKYFKNSTPNRDKTLGDLKQKFSSCHLLAKNGREYNSNELYSLRFHIMHNIDSNSVPLLDYEEELPEDLERWLSFKMDLDIKCILQLLKVIEEKPELGNGIFFKTLLEQLKQKDREEIKKYHFSLLSKENKLKPAKDLYYFIEEDATCRLDSYYLKKLHGMTHEETLKLADLCGVNTLPYEQNVEREKETEDNTLKEFYLERLPFIVLQESRERNEPPSIILKLLYDAICSVKLYQCCSINVRYPFGNPVKIREQFDKLTFYVVGKWTKFKTRIHDYIWKQLDFKTNIMEIIDMESTEDDVQEWLSYKNEADQQTFYEIQMELQKLMYSQGEINALTPFENVNIDQPYNSEDDGENSIDRELPGNKYLTSPKSFANESSAAFVKLEHYFQSQPVIKAVDPTAAASLDEGRVCFIENDHCLQTRENFENVNIDQPYNSQDGGENFIERELSENKDLTSSKSFANESSVAFVKHERCFQSQSMIKTVDPTCASSLDEGCVGFVENEYCLQTREIKAESSEETANMKRLNKKDVISFFQDFYKNKYPNSQFNLLDGFFTLQSEPRKVEIIWLNKSIEEELQKIICSLEKINTIMHFENVNVDQQYHSEDDGKNSINSKLSGNKELAASKSSANESLVAFVKPELCFQAHSVIKTVDLTAASSSYEDCVDFVESERCLQTRDIKTESSGAAASLIDEQEAIAGYESVSSSTGNISADITEVGVKWLVPRAQEINLKKFQQPENHPAGCSRFLQGVHENIHMKRLSKKHVISLLQNYYKNNNPNSQFNLLNRLFTLEPESCSSHKIQIIWLSKSIEKGYKYDLLLKSGELTSPSIFHHLWFTADKLINVVNDDFSSISHHKLIEKINQLALSRHKEKYDKSCIRWLATKHVITLEEFIASDQTRLSRNKDAHYLDSELSRNKQLTAAESSSHESSVGFVEHEIKLKTKDVITLKHHLASDQFHQFIEKEVQYLDRELSQNRELAAAETSSGISSIGFDEHEPNLKTKHTITLEDLFVSESSLDKGSVNFIEDEPQYAIKAKSSGASAVLIDERRYETTVDSVGDIGEDIETWLIPSKPETRHNKGLQQPEIPGNYHSSIQSLHAGSFTVFQDTTFEKYIKRLSEMYVFTFLQNRYKNKYPNSQFYVLDGDFILQWQSIKIEIIWLNENKDKELPYDLLLKKDGEVKWLIEVNSTNVENNDSFVLNHRQFIEKINQLAVEMPEHKEKYCVYHVFNAGNSSVSNSEKLHCVSALYKVVLLNNL